MPLFFTSYFFGSNNAVVVMKISITSGLQLACKKYGFNIHAIEFGFDNKRVPFILFGSKYLAFRAKFFVPQNEVSTLGPYSQEWILMFPNVPWISSSQSPPLQKTLVTPLKMLQ